MKVEYVAINKVKTNPNNPRVIKDLNFQKLVKSIVDFPQMLERIDVKRPIPALKILSDRNTFKAFR